MQNKQPDMPHAVDVVSLSLSLSLISHSHTHTQHTHNTHTHTGKIELRNIALETADVKLLCDALKGRCTLYELY